MTRLGWIMALAAVSAAPAKAQEPVTDPTAFASSAEVREAVAALGKAMQPGQGFAYRPLVRDGTTVAALEYWRAPGKPAVHPSQAEYAIVIEGSGTLVSGGSLVDRHVVRPGLTEGSAITGGTTRPLAAGDVLLIPAGVPHWFGVAGHLVLLGIKFPGTPTDQ